MGGLGRRFKLSEEPPVAMQRSVDNKSSTQPSSTGQGSSQSRRTTQLKQGLRNVSFAEGEARLAAGDAKIQQLAADGVSGAGGQLPHLDTVQAAFGHHDVSGVRAHGGAQAQKATSEMGAEAFATGQDVAFGGSPDLHTVAHEAAHVVQQKRGVALSGGVGRSGDAYEQHADAVADAVVAGQSAEGLLEAGPSGGGAQAAVQGLFGFGDDDEGQDSGGSGDQGGGQGGGWMDQAKSKAGQAWDGAKEAAGNAWDGAKEAAGGAWDGAKEAAGGAWDGAKEAAGGAWDGAKEAAGNAWDGAKEAAGGAWEGAKEAGGEAVKGAKEAVGGAWEGAKKAGGELADELGGAWAELKELAGDKWEEVKALAKKYGPEAVLSQAKAPPQKESVVGLGNKFTTESDEKVLYEHPAGTISGKLAMDIVYKFLSDPDGDSSWSWMPMFGSDKKPDDGPGAPERTVGAANGANGKYGLAAEAKNEIAQAFGATASLKAIGEAQVSPKGKAEGKLATAGEIEFKLGKMPMSLVGEFSLIKYEQGKGIKVGVFEAAIEAKAGKFEYTCTEGQMKGAKVAVEVVPKGVFTFDPNELWFAEKCAAWAVGGAGIPSALLVGGLLSVGTSLVRLASMDNVHEGRDTAKRAAIDMHRYGHDFVNTLAGKSYAPTQGGGAALDWLKQLEQAEGPAAVQTFVQSFSPAATYTQAVSQAWRETKQKAIDAYWKAHPAEKIMSLGGHGPKSDGMQTLERFMADDEPWVTRYSS
jgi:hypothetical protein